MRKRHPGEPNGRLPNQAQSGTFGFVLRFCGEKHVGFSYIGKNALSIFDKDLGEIPTEAFPARLKAYVGQMRKYAVKELVDPAPTRCGYLRVH